jgi:hypothetical protein
MTFVIVTRIFKFSVYGSVHRKYILLYIQQDAALHSLFISGNCSTCFGWYLHPSSGEQTTVSAASGICHTVIATCCYYIWKLLYMFRMVPPPIIRRANNCVCSIWYLSQRYCYLPLLYLETARHVSGGTSTHHQESKQLCLQHLVFVRPLLLPAAIAAGNSNGLTNTRCCRYSCLLS